MYATIQKWGNSHGIRLPKSLLDAIGVTTNDRVELVQAGATVTIKRAIPQAHRTLEERLTTFYGKPIDEIQRIPDEEVEWGKAQGDEVW